MKNDFDLIVKKFPTTMNEINIYPLGDLHIGSPEFSHQLWQRWKQMVMNDSNGYVVLVGDLIDNGLKTSKTNSYNAAIRPREQKKWLLEQLTPMKDKILGGVQGNHEIRSSNDTDNCPLYDIMETLLIPDLYRENMAFIKINLGIRKKPRQVSYVLALNHGGSRNKTENFSYVMDGIDVFVTGHDHGPKSRFPNKIVVDTKNEIVRLVDFTHITVPSFSIYGGYALRNMYMPQGNKIPILTLSGEKKTTKTTWV